MTETVKMNCEESRRLSLLADSGELSGGTAGQLEAHLAACDACRAWRDGVRDVFSAAKNALPAGEPSPAVMSRIRAAAERRTGARVILFRQPLFGAIAAAAAAVLIAAGGWLMLAPGKTAPSKHVDRLLVIAAAVSENGVHEPAARNGTEHDQKLRALGAQLLLMEGLVAEESADANLNGAFLAPDA